MGGVAIAISLVPPLCVVGISLQKGQLDAAAGASLLFMTNFLAILLAGGVVLIVLGLGRSAVLREQVRIRRRGLVLFVACILLVTIPLSQTAYQSIMNAEANNNATTTVQQWLQGTSYQVDMVNVNDRVVRVTVEGTGEMKPLHQLANQLAVALGRPVLVNLLALPTQIGKSSSP